MKVFLVSCDTGTFNQTSYGAYSSLLAAVRAVRVGIKLTGGYLMSSWTITEYELDGPLSKPILYRPMLENGTWWKLITSRRCLPISSNSGTHKWVCTDIPIK